MILPQIARINTNEKKRKDEKRFAPQRTPRRTLHRDHSAKDLFRLRAKRILPL